MGNKNSGSNRKPGAPPIPGAGRKRNKTPTRQISIRFPISLIISAEMRFGKPFDMWLKQQVREACNDPINQ